MLELQEFLRRSILFPSNIIEELERYRGVWAQRTAAKKL
jgi:hypothetical protein